MTIEFELSNHANSEWDKSILNNSTPEFCQTSIFGKFLNRIGAEVNFLLIYDRGELVGNCLLEVKKEKIASWRYGPKIRIDRIDDEEAILMQMFRFLQNSKFKAIEQTQTAKNFPDEGHFNENSTFFSRIGSSPYIDIRPDMDKLLHNFDRSVHKNVNKCIRAGVDIKISETNELVGTYLDLLTWFRENRNFDLPFLHPNEETMKLFNNSITNMGIALAYLNGRAIAGMGFIRIGKIMTELAIATSHDYESLKLPANDFLKIKAIEFYKDKGIEFYDLAGGEKNPNDSKKKNILKYKMKFATGSTPYGFIDRKILSINWFPYAVKRKLIYIFKNK